MVDFAASARRRRPSRRRWNVLVGLPGAPTDRLSLDPYAAQSERLKSIVAHALLREGTMAEGPLLKASALWIHARWPRVATTGAAVLSDLHGPILAHDGPQGFTPGYKLFRDDRYFTLSEIRSGRATRVHVRPVAQLPDLDESDRVLAEDLRLFLKARAEHTLETLWLECIRTWDIDAVAGPLFAKAVAELSEPHPTLEGATERLLSVRELMAKAEKKCTLAGRDGHPRAAELTIERGMILCLGSMLQMAYGVRPQKGIDPAAKIAAYLRETRSRADAIGARDPTFAESIRGVVDALQAIDFRRAEEILSRGSSELRYIPPETILRVKQLHMVGEVLASSLSSRGLDPTAPRIFTSFKHGLPSSRRAIIAIREVLERAPRKHVVLAADLPVPTMDLREKESALIQISDAVLVLIPPERNGDRFLHEILFEVREAQRWRIPIIVLWGRPKNEIHAFKLKHGVRGEFLPWDFRGGLALERLHSVLASQLLASASQPQR